MTLVDTSVVIDYLRTGDAKLLSLFGSLPGGICGVTRAEILHGARNPADRAKLITVLDAFAQVPIPQSLWDAAGDLLAALRLRGVIVPTTDVLIAAIAIAKGVELWTRDTHFPLIAQAEPRLVLFQEPS